MSRASAKDFLFRWFSPLPRVRERGGGEGRRINEVNRITACASTSSPESFEEQKKPAIADGRHQAHSRWRLRPRRASPPPDSVGAGPRLNVRHRDGAAFVHPDWSVRGMRGVGGWL
ncbi:hypothetical protein CBM2623_B30383 [Cupriavidus taiwanensis]|nr:hypothetical protein CBM2608_B30381 [Cupriavidus taiwanensis]SPA34827.1 hypothetical protein CBM2623_B30383 [Cupriavidus taiwanensis]